MLSFCARAAVMTASCATWVMTPELYPTAIRSTGHSFANSVARVGAFMSPYLVESSISVPIVVVVLAAFSVIAAGTSFALPETKNRSLDDSAVEMVRRGGAPTTSLEPRSLPWMVVVTLAWLLALWGLLALLH